MTPWFPFRGSEQKITERPQGSRKSALRENLFFLIFDFVRRKVLIKRNNLLVIKSQSFWRNSLIRSYVLPLSSKSAKTKGAISFFRHLQFALARNTGWCGKENTLPYRKIWEEILKRYTDLCVLEWFECFEVIFKKILMKYLSTFIF